MAGIEGLNKVSEFLKAVQRDVFGSSAMAEVGERFRDVIYRRTKSGYGVNNDQLLSPSKVVLNGLSASYINQRRKRGVKGAFGSPGTSNLTNTGQLLDSFVVSAKIGGVSIDIPNTRRKGKGKQDTNKRIAQFVATQGRPFFALTQDEQTLVRRDIEDRIRKVFTKFF